MNRRWPLVIGCFCLLVSGAASWRFLKPAHLEDDVVFQLAYPIKSLDPTHSKDWETISINNHIFLRLISGQRGPTVPYLTSEIKFTCISPKGSILDEHCREVQISFQPTLFKDCMGRDYTVEDIQTEFEAILKSTPWSLPKSKRCRKANAGEVCVTGNYRADVQRRMHSVTMRFGWSKQQVDDSKFGAGPYCLYVQSRSEQGLTAGTLIPRPEATRLPRIRFQVSQDPTRSFDFALYGSKELLVNERKNIQAHTPIGYYVVTNPSLAGSQVPWNLKKTRKEISDTFFREQVFFQSGSNISNIFPPGAAVSADVLPSARGRKLEFVLPDYLPACKELAASLTKDWGREWKAEAFCKDVVSFVYNHVWNSRRDWDGFIVGVTQPDPGRNTVEYEYFSPDSPDSWVYDYPKPMDLYYLAGVGQSIVTVDGKRFCGLRPNQLGLGDIFVTDLVPCKRVWFWNSPW